MVRYSSCGKIIAVGEMTYYETHGTYEPYDTSFASSENAGYQKINKHMCKEFQRLDGRRCGRREEPKVYDGSSPTVFCEACGLKNGFEW